MLKASDNRFVHQMTVQHFYRNKPFQNRMPGLVDHTHAAGSDKFKKLIIAYKLPAFTQSIGNHSPVLRTFGHRQWHFQPAGWASMSSGKFYLSLLPLRGH
jgi:hypothetical protein